MIQGAQISISFILFDDFNEAIQPLTITQLSELIFHTGYICQLTVS
jgi:hypothetical protein